MSSRSPRIPKYCHHKHTNRAYVTLDGREHWLGKYGTDASRQKYDHTIKSYLRSNSEAVIPPQPTPAYRRLSEDRARVTLNGQDFALGKFGSAESKDKYHQIVTSPC